MTAILPIFICRKHLGQSCDIDCPPMRSVSQSDQPMPTEPRTAARGKARRCWYTRRHSRARWRVMPSPNATAPLPRRPPSPLCVAHRPPLPITTCLQDRCRAVQNHNRMHMPCCAVLCRRAVPCCAALCPGDGCPPHNSYTFLPAIPDPPNLWCVAIGL
eukprot:SAG11_NODE_9_length_28972_cov_81.532539_22_plen_159_part_00